MKIIGVGCGPGLLTMQAIFYPRPGQFFR